MTQPSLGFRPAVPDEVAGWIDLAVVRHGHRTRPIKTKSSGVLRLMQPLYLDDSGQLTYIVMNPGGAYFGERYRYAIDVLPDAQLLLSTQSASRIYKTPVRPAVQEIAFTLGPGARLEYIPDQTIAYRNADYRQVTRIVAAPDAEGFFAEIITPGWDPDGARFTYSDMRLRLEVREPGMQGLVCVDNLRFRPGQIGDAIGGIGYLEGASHLGTALILGPHTRGEYIDRLREIVGACHSVNAGVTSGTRHGVSWLMVRALASSTGALHGMMLNVNELDRSVTTGQSRLDLRRY